VVVVVLLFTEPASQASEPKRVNFFIIPLIVERLKVNNLLSASSTSGHEVRPLNDPFRPDDCFRLVKVKVKRKVVPVL
jgi:hypothetical protein